MANLKRKAFIRAYLGEAHGNATQAALLAGYSKKTAASQGSRLLKDANIHKVLQKHVAQFDLSTDATLQRVGTIATAEPKNITAREVLKANELILKVNGALDKQSGESRVTVNIGFLTSHHEPPRAVVVMPSSSQVTVLEDGSE
jgi:phage terminase small subunit